MNVFECDTDINQAVKSEVEADGGLTVLEIKLKDFSMNVWNILLSDSLAQFLMHRNSVEVCQTVEKIKNLVRDADDL